MRDNSECMVEIIRTYEERTGYFMVVGKTIDGNRKSYAFCLSEKAYVLMNKVLGFYPFDKMSKADCRFYHAGINVRKDTEKNKQFTSFRIEQGGFGKEFEFEIELECLKNLFWFYELKDFKQAGHLKEIK